MKARPFRQWGGILLALSTLLLQLPARAKLDTVRFTWVVTSNNDKQFKFEGMGADFVIDWGDGEKDSLNVSASVDLPTRLAPLIRRAIEPPNSCFHFSISLYNFRLKIIIITKLFQVQR